MDWLDRLNDTIKSWFSSEEKTMYEPPNPVVAAGCDFHECNLLAAFNTFIGYTPKGHPIRLYYLGLLYENGYGVITPNVDDARRCFQAGFGIGSVLCSAHFISHYHPNREEEEHVKESLRTCIADGDVRAMNEMEYFEPSEHKWNKSAAKSGYWKAMLDLAQDYWKEGNYSEARKYAVMAIDHNCMLGYRILADDYLLGKSVKQDIQMGILKLIEWDMKEPNPELKYEIGSIYESQNDMKNARSWYRQAAPDLLLQEDKATARRNYYAGILKDKGIGTPKDMKGAIHSYSLAALKGDKDAQYYLGLLHLQGTRVKKDPIEAARLFTKAAESGQRDAAFYLGMMFLQGYGVDKNQESAYRYIIIAYGLGHVTAKVALAHCYCEGIEVNVDLERARDLLSEVPDTLPLEADNNLLKNVRRKLELLEQRRKIKGYHFTEDEIRDISEFMEKLNRI